MNTNNNILKTSRIRLITLIGVGLWSPLCTGIAQNFRIEIFSLEQNIGINLPANTNYYYMLLHKNDLFTALTNVVDMELGHKLLNSSLWHINSIGAETGFYAVKGLPLNASQDSDMDGIDDVFELRTSFLDPLNIEDAGYDEDSDLVSNLDEYYRGTSPDDPLSKQGVVYADAIMADNKFSGFAPKEKIKGNNGPKRDLQNAIDVAVSGDTVCIATGDYQTAHINVQNKTVLIQMNGLVILDQ